MELQPQTDTPSGRTRCPVSGLPVRTEPAWAFHNAGTDYHLRISSLGDRILWVKASGYTSLEDAKQTLQLTIEIVNRVIPAPQKYVSLIDFTGLTGASLQAKRYFVETMKKRDRLAALVFFGLSPVTSLMIKLGASAARVEFDVLRTSDYATAVDEAMQILGHPRPGSSTTPDPEVA